ncbi:MAG TPA: SDR family NAD(P)-dependent oxidoreductase [Bacteroidales bacterium]|nr:SDR family NAD(P)-dependent oxidoreductase [Bacteroidales bacterium]
MSRIFITGSSDGLGLLTAKTLIHQGHKVVVHARNEKRGNEALEKLPGAESVLTADLSDAEETKLLASKVNDLGAFDVVIHNAGVYNTSERELFNVNTLAPYILTCLIQKPKRLIYLSSGMHKSGHFRQESFNTDINRIIYSDTKLQVVILCNSVARKCPDVYANSVNPGWVPTKMGGPGAPDNLEKGYQTQVWLATSNDDKAKVSGRYFYHMKETHSNPDADDESVQEKFLAICKEITGISFPLQH